MARVAPRLICFIAICVLGACAAENSGVPAINGVVDRSSASSTRAAAVKALLSLHGTVESLKPGHFVLRTKRGKVSVDLSSHTVVHGRLHDGDYAQVVGRGDGRDRAHYVAVWRSPPPLLTVRGQIAGSTELGISLDRAGSSSATIVVIASSTKTPPALPVGEEVSVVGYGSPERGIVATRVSAEPASPSPSPSAAPTPTATAAPTATPNPTPTPTPAPTPRGIALGPGEVVGQDDQFTPPDGDSSTGGQSQTVDGIPCVPTMFNNYHVHVYVGLYVNGKQVAIPDQIGMYQPGQISNGYTNTATCFYYIHTHDASGMVHIESPEDEPVSATMYTLRNVFDVWGMTVGPNNVGPFRGTVRTFIGRAPLGTTEVSPSSYTEYFGDPNVIALYSHQAIWFEVGPPYYTPPYIPEIVFYNEY